jgi:hypothetical protein
MEKEGLVENDSQGIVFYEVGKVSYNHFFDASKTNVIETSLGTMGINNRE